jgi:hypothetical protein
MMTDFMHEDMGDDFAERGFMLRPVIEDRASVKPYHIGELSGHGRCAALRTSTAAKQTQKIKFALAIHRIERFIIRKIFDADYDTLAKTAKSCRQGGESRLCHQLKIGERRRGEVKNFGIARFQEGSISVAGGLRRLKRT